MKTDFFFSGSKILRRFREKKVSPHFPKEHIGCKQCSGRPGLVPQRIHQCLFLERARSQSVNCYQCLSSYCVPSPVFTPNNTTLKEVLSSPLSREKNEDLKSLDNLPKFSQIIYSRHDSIPGLSDSTVTDNEENS